MRTRSTSACLAFLAVLVGALSLAGPGGQADALTYGVTNASNGLPGSLPAAISAANGHSGADVIRFAIPGAGVHTITPATSLVIRDPLAIQGYTQPGSSRATQSAPARPTIVIVAQTPCPTTAFTFSQTTAEFEASPSSASKAPASMARPF